MPQDTFLNLLDITTGKVLQRDRLQRGIKRAFQTGLFEDITVERADPASSALVVTVKERRVIDSIRIEGNSSLPDKTVKRRLGIEKGGRLRVVALEEGIRSIKRAFASHGYPRAIVSYKIVPGKKNKADLLISIQENSPEIVRSIVIKGPEDVVQNFLRLARGDVFDRHAMEDMKSSILRFYNEQHHVGTGLTYTYSEGLLTITLDPGKELAISFKNNAALGDKVLMREVPFFERNEFTEDLVEEAVSRIIALYHTRGYPFAQVTPVVAKADNAIALDLFIFEGEKYTIDAITFEGNSIPEDKLRAVLSFRVHGNYDPGALESNTETLREFYRALGYLYVEIKDPEVTMTDSRALIKYVIKEGPQIKIADVFIRGNKALSAQELQNAIPLHKGAPYNEVDLLDARRKVAELYGSRGYLDARIDISREIKNSSADIIFTIQEGDVSRFGKSIIVGNERTRPKIIAREFVHEEGAPLNSDLIVRERQQLYRLGLFTDVNIELAEGDNNERDLIYHVTEAKPGAVEFGVGYGEYERYRGFFEIAYRNLWGLNRQISFRTEVSSLEQRFILSYLEPWFLNKELPFRLLFLHENRKEKNIDTGETRYRLRRDTATAGIEKRISEKTKAELYYDFSVVKTFDVKPDVILTREDTGTLIISALRTGIIYDTRDNPFDPRKGIVAGLTLKAASAVLFSETDFLKASAYVNNYQSLSKRNVLAISLRGGLANGFGDTRELPLVERFFLGGRTTVRGYSQDNLGPKGSDGTPTGGNAFLMGNLELRTDIGKGFGIVTFLDSGNVWQKAEDVKISSLKYTTGLGLRYNTPVGPLRVDYGVKLNRETGESRGEIHFSLGQAF